MNDQYLWDKSGEPDEEIQHLETLLQEFSYQPRPLVLPEETPQKRWAFATAAVSTVSYRYAAIAAMMLLALGLGLWLGTRQAPQNNVVIVDNQPTRPAPQPQIQPDAPQPKISDVTPPRAPRSQFIKHVAAPKNKPRFIKAVHQGTKKLSAEEEARDKVLYALQITNQSLDLVRSKMQTDTN